MFELCVPVTPADHAIGTVDAPVTVVEYGDFECPNCKQAAPAVKLLLRHFERRIRFVFRHFPLEEVHAHAIRAAEAAECAGTQDKFWPMHDTLFERQPHLALPELRGYAVQLQLDLDRYDRDMEGRVHLAKVREDMESGRKSGARSTPTFFVNSRICDVSYDLKALFDAVERALRK